VVAGFAFIVNGKPASTFAHLAEGDAALLSARRPAGGGRPASPSAVGPLGAYRKGMTTTETGHDIPVRLDFDRHAPSFSRAMVHLDNAATKELDRVALDPRLRELVRIRASQINGCAYCIDMHTKDARAIGEAEQRLYGLSAWRETPYFSERERAALAFTESVTLVAVDHVPGQAFEAVSEHFNPDEIAALLGLIVAINAWNTLSVATHAWAPGSYQP
jgi:AhpD family alkylhydroperoxidase